MKLTWRNATLNDSKDVFIWRNDEISRLNSGNLSEIAWEVHETWFSSRLAKQSAEPFILFCKGDKSIGVVRYDLALDCPNRFEVSLLVNPEYRKLGFGKQILLASFTELNGLPPKYSLTARILPENLASIRIFTECGFSFMEQREKFLIFEKN